MRLSFFIVALVLLPLQGGAFAGAEPPARVLSVRAAIAAAARQNPGLGAAVAEVDAAAARAVAAWGADDFLLDASARWLRSRRSIVAETPLLQPRQDNLLVELALARPLPTGGLVGLRLSGELDKGAYVSDLGGAAATSTSQLAVPSLQLFASHPLLRGAGIAVARADRRRARVGQDLAALEREATAAQLVRAVVAACSEIWLGSEELEIRRALTDSARQQLLAVEAAIGVGKQPRSASAEVKVAVALREDEAIAVEESLHGQTLELARLLGLPLDAAAARLVVTGADETAGEPPRPEDALAAAMERDPQLAAARARGGAAAIELEVGQNGLLPRLDLAVSGAARGYGTDLAAGLSALRQDRSYEVQVALVFQEPLGRHAARGARDAAGAQLHKARLTEADVSAQIRAQVLRQLGLVESVQRRLDALAEIVAAASLDLAAERARFEVGRGTNFDVLRRQEELAQARLHVAQARAEQRRALASLEALTGAILPHYGVVLR